VSPPSITRLLAFGRSRHRFDQPWLLPGEEVTAVILQRDRYRAALEAIVANPTQNGLLDSGRLRAIAEEALGIKEPLL